MALGGKKNTDGYRANRQSSMRKRRAWMDGEAEEEQEQDGDRESLIDIITEIARDSGQLSCEFEPGENARGNGRAVYHAGTQTDSYVRRDVKNTNTAHAKLVQAKRFIIALKEKLTLAQETLCKTQNDYLILLST